MNASMLESCGIYILGCRRHQHFIHTLNFEIQKWMWTYAVTCCADCITLLAGRVMIICHEVWSLSTGMKPLTVYSNTRCCCSYVTDNSREIHHMCMVLTLPNELLFLLQWHDSYDIINCPARRILEPNFWHDNCKNLAKMTQAYQGTVKLCQ